MLQLRVTIGLLEFHIIVKSKRVMHKSQSGLIGVKVMVKSERVMYWS